MYPVRSLGWVSADVRYLMPAETLETYIALGIPPTVLGTHLKPQRMNLEEDPFSFLSAIDMPSA